VWTKRWHIREALLTGDRDQDWRLFVWQKFPNYHNLALFVPPDWNGGYLRWDSNCVCVKIELVYAVGTWQSDSETSLWANHHKPDTPYRDSATGFSTSGFLHGPVSTKLLNIPLGAFQIFQMNQRWFMKKIWIKRSRATVPLNWEIQWWHIQKPLGISLVVANCWGFDEYIQSQRKVKAYANARRLANIPKLSDWRSK